MSIFDKINSAKEGLKSVFDRIRETQDEIRQSARTSFQSPLIQLPESQRQQSKQVAQALPKTQSIPQGGKFAQDVNQLNLKKNLGPTVEFGKAVARDFPRSIASAQLEFQGRKSFTPETGVEKFLFGSEPVENIRGTGKTFLSSVGKPSEFQSDIAGTSLVFLGAMPFVGGGTKKIGEKITRQLIEMHGDDVARAVIKQGDNFAKQALMSKTDDLVKQLSLRTPQQPLTRASLESHVKGTAQNIHVLQQGGIDPFEKGVLRQTTKMSMLDDLGRKFEILHNRPGVIEKLKSEFAKTQFTSEADFFKKTAAFLDDTLFTKSDDVVPQLSTKIVKELGQRSRVAKQFITDLLKTPGVKDAEKSLVTDVLKEFEGKVPIREFADKVRARLLPLQRTSSDLVDVTTSRPTVLKQSIFQPKYNSTSLPEELRGPVQNYSEHVYQSPVPTSVGDIHFSSNTTPNYFAHTRVEDLSDETTRRVIEIQSDLFQKKALANELTDSVVTREGNQYAIRLPDGDFYDTYATRQQAEDALASLTQPRQSELSQLTPYRDTWHERIIREELKRAAEDGKQTLLIPTGKTSMQVEGLGEQTRWFNAAPRGEGTALSYRQANLLTPDDLKVGKVIKQGFSGEDWVITDVLRDGKFKAVSKSLLDNAQIGEGLPRSIGKNKEEALKALAKNAETFDISGKVDTSNPIYKFYENTIGKYIKNKYGAKEITDGQGVSWFKVNVDRALRDEPVEAFGAVAGIEVDEEGNVGFDPQKAALGIGIGLGAKKVVPQTFRTDKISITPEIQDGLNKRLTALGLSTRTVKSFDEMAQAAQELGTDPQRLLREISTSRIADDEVIALRNSINQDAQFIVKQEKIIAEGELTLKDLELGRITDLIKQAEKRIDDATKKLVKGGTAAGRTIAAFRVQAAQSMDPAVWFVKAQRVLGRRDLTIEMKQAIMDLIKQNDQQGLANFVSMLRSADWSEQAVTLWKAGLLTAPTTHLANIGGNTTMSALMTASDLVAAPFDVLASLVTGKRTTTVGRRTVGAKLRGLKIGAKEGYDFLKTGRYPSDLLQKYDLPDSVTFENPILKGYTEAVFRSLGAEDIVFRTAAMTESLEKEAIVIAKNEGLSGQAAFTRIKELLQKPTNEMITNSIDAAEYATFQSPNVLAKGITGMRNALATIIKKGEATGELKDILMADGARVASLALEFIAPFTRTPTNIAARMADFSPVGIARAFSRLARPTTRSQRQFVQDLSRGVTGTGLMALGAYFYKKGIMTGSIPENSSERADFYAAGKQRSAFRFGDRWYRLDKTSPVGNLLSLGAEFQRLSKDASGLELAGATFAAGLKGLTEQTFLQGVSGGLKAINEPTQFGPSFVRQSASSVIPTIVRRAALTVDPVMREEEGLIDAFKNKIPGLRKQLAPRRDVFGDIVTTPGGRTNLIDPFQTSKAKDEPALKEAERLGTTIGLPSETVNGVKLDTHEYSLYQKVNGRILKVALTQLLADPDYKELPTNEQRDLFDKTVKDVRTQVKNSVFAPLMITRYDLPSDTDPALLKDVLSQLNDVEGFADAKPEKQKKIIQGVLQGTLNNSSETKKKTDDERRKESRQLLDEILKTSVSPSDIEF